MEEGSRRGIYGERILLCRRVSSGNWRELSEQAVRDILKGPLLEKRKEGSAEERRFFWGILAGCYGGKAWRRSRGAEEKAARESYPEKE